MSIAAAPSVMSWPGVRRARGLKGRRAVSEGVSGSMALASPALAETATVARAGALVQSLSGIAIMRAVRTIPWSRTRGAGLGQALAFRNRNAFAYSIAGMEHDFISFHETRYDLCNPVVSLTYRDDGAACTAISNGKNGPIVSLAEKRADRHRQDSIGLPNGNIDDDTVTMPKLRP